MDNGKFYTIVPNNVKEEHLYDFEIGGRVYPYKREEGTSIQQVINHSDNIVIRSLHEYVIKNRSNCICIEDYSADPTYKYVRDSDRQYYLIDNRIFYLIDDSYSLEEIKQYFNWANSFGFLCMLVKISSGLPFLRLHQHATINDFSKRKIFNGINSFLIEIYDGESYLLWIDDIDGGFFLDILNKRINITNA